MWVMMHKEITERQALLDENSDVKNLFVQVLYRVEDPNWVVLIAEKEGKTVGFIMGFVHWPQYSKCHVIGTVEALYMNEDHRGNGEYKQLINEIEKIGKEKGVKEHEFTCAYNSKMIRFYENLGYEPVQVVLRQKGV